MLLLVLVYLLIPIAFTAVLYITGVRSRKVLAVPPAAFVLLPFLLAAALGTIGVRNHWGQGVNFTISLSTLSLSYPLNSI
ncbi:MAG: hypothetical protein P1S59_12615, partial [bacterium]|nr:hypothetical protein [bacterium]